MPLKLVYEHTTLGKVYLSYYGNNLEAFYRLEEGKDLEGCAPRFLYTTVKDKTETELWNTVHKDWIMGEFEFSPLPGCCGIVVSHGTRRTNCLMSWSKEVSDKFRSIKEEFAKHLGYSMMIATTDMNNIPAVKNLFKSGYKVDKTFNNSRTGNTVAIGMKPL